MHIYKHWATFIDKRKSEKQIIFLYLKTSFM